MAQEIVGIKLQVESNAGESVGSLKKQLREAQTEVATLSDKFGATSKQAVEAAKRAADLRDRIGDAKALTDAFNPDRKFQAFASALQGVVGGFTAVQGALGLVGVESEDVEKALLKVNSAMALSQGLNSILEARDSFKNLGTVIQSTTIFQKANNIATTAAIALQRAFGVATVQTAAGFRILKTAIAATGIGLLVVGLTALISKISEWTSSTDKAAESQKKLEEKTELLNAKLNNEIAILTALGGKEDEIYRKRIEGINNELNAIRGSVKQKDGLSKEELKKFGELKTQLVVLEIEEKNRIKKINEDAQKEKEKKDKEAADKAKAIAQERLQANIEAEGQIRKLRQDAELNAIEDQNKRAIRQAEIDFENRKLEIEALKANEQLKTQLITEEQKKRDLIIADLKNEAIQAELTAIIDGFAAQEAADKAEEERRKAQQQKEFDDLFAQLDRETKAEQAYSDAKKKIAEEEARVRIENTQKVAGILTGLSDLFGKETAAGKATAIAAATINTYLAASQALTGIKKLNPIGATIAIAQAALVIANGLKQVREIAKVKVPNGGGAVSVPAPISQSAGGVAPLSPQAPVTATFTQLDQGTINQLGAATNRAYVVETDITNSQERIRRINRAARLE